MSLPAYPLGFGSDGLPSIPGLKLRARHGRHWKTDVQEAASEIESRVSFQGAKRRSLEFEYGYLTDAQATTLADFFDTMKGRTGAFTMYLPRPWAGTQIVARFDADDLGIETDETNLVSVPPIPFKELLGEGS